MEKAKFLETLIKEQGYNLKSFAAACDIPYTTLYGIIKNGVGKAGVDNILTICRHLGITVEELNEMEFGTTPLIIYDAVAEAKNVAFFKVLSKLL